MSETGRYFGLRSLARGQAISREAAGVYVTEPRGSTLLKTVLSSMDSASCIAVLEPLWENTCAARYNPWVRYYFRPTYVPHTRTCQRPDGLPRRFEASSLRFHSQLEILAGFETTFWVLKLVRFDCCRKMKK
jgi:hypothetical protein